MAKRRSVPDLRTVNTTVSPWYPVVSNLHMLLISIPTESKFFRILTTQNIFSMLTDENSQYLFTFTWEEQQYNWMVIFIPRVSQSPPYFSQDLKADLDDRKFGEGSIFLKY